MLRPWSQQARQLTPRRGTLAHLGNLGCYVHIHRRFIIQRGHEHTRGESIGIHGPTGAVVYTFVSMSLGEGSITPYRRRDEQALVSLSLKKIIDAEVC